VAKSSVISPLRTIQCTRSEFTESITYPMIKLIKSAIPCFATPGPQLILNFNFFFLLFGCSPFVHVHDWTAHGKPMLISRNQVRAHGIIEGSTGSAIRTSGTMMIKPLLFYGFRSNYLSVFNITFYLFDVGDDYLKSCVAEVIKSSWSWVSLR